MLRGNSRVGTYLQVQGPISATASICGWRQTFSDYLQLLAEPSLQSGLIRQQTQRLKPSSSILLYIPGLANLRDEYELMKLKQDAKHPKTHPITSVCQGPAGMESMGVILRWMKLRTPIVSAQLEWCWCLWSRAQFESESRSTWTAAWEVHLLPKVLAQLSGASKLDANSRFHWLNHALCFNHFGISSAHKHFQKINECPRSEIVKSGNSPQFAFSEYRVHKVIVALVRWQAVYSIPTEYYMALLT